MKRFLVLVCIIVSICMSVILASADSPQADDEVHDVEINEYNFPDYTFREHVCRKFDADEDGILCVAEIMNVKKITIETIFVDTPVENIIGIKQFVALESLTIGNEFGAYKDKITDIDVSGMKKLAALECDYMPNLRSLDVNGCTSLYKISCCGTGMKELDVSNLPSLGELHCSNKERKDGWHNKDYDFYRDNTATPLEKLNLRNCTGLYLVNCSGNELTELDVSDCVYLGNLDCSNNKLTELDVRNCKNLYELNCSQNKLTKIDVSHLKNLNKVNCSSNRLTEFTAKNATIKELDCRENNLDEVDLSTAEVTKSNCYFDKGVEVDYGTSFLLYFFIAVGAIVIVGVAVMMIKNIKHNKRVKELASNYEMPEWYKKQQ